MLGMALSVLVLLFAIFHPILKNLRETDGGFDEEDEEIGLH